ncbi:MAG: hypothetical protein ACYCUV_13770, partial [Phycisphaerae bacterium]
MNKLSRRNLLAGLAMAGVASFGDSVNGNGAQAAGLPPGPTAPDSKPILSPVARKAAAEKLLTYFHRVAPQLLRPAQGLLRHPSIS